MQVLEKILQKIEERIIVLDKKAKRYDESERQNETDKLDCEIKGLNTAVNIIRFHMEDDGWIPIAEGLPPVGKPLDVTIKDHMQGRMNERRYPVYYEKDSMKGGYHWSWRYGDFAYELLPDVSEVIAW